MDEHRGRGRITLKWLRLLHQIHCQTNNLRQLGGLHVLKSERVTEGAHISKHARSLDTVLASVSLMSQLAGIHILAKQKDNYASAWCEMCWWRKQIHS